MTTPAYLNPVYPHSFPDPFVLKVRGEYWGYCTGFWHDGRAFGIARSPDLVHWTPMAGALEPLPGGHTCYWAPEVSGFEGRFYLYYSVGNEERMEIRVAVADHPAGPFADSGRRLTSEPFAIDAHVFTDTDGGRWLFYATDFLDHSHIGTGTVRDRLLDPFTLEGNPRPVALPRHDWHVYHPNRPEKGFVRWHTVEGPFVLRRKGRYYEMFSGGNWQNPTYGVAFATTTDLAQPEEWEQAPLPILRSGGEVVGPGHNSVVRGPDNRQLYCVYHRWSPDLKERVMAIDPLDFVGDRMIVLGPTTTPQPAPNPPTISDSAVLEPGEERRYPVASSFLLEATVRGGCEMVFPGEKGPLRIDLSSDLPRLVRVEADGPRVAVSFDNGPSRLETAGGETATVVLAATGRSAEIAGLEITLGWEDLFEDIGGRLRLDGPAWIAKGPDFPSYLAVINVRLDGEGAYAFAPALAQEDGPWLVLGGREGAWTLEHGEHILPLPAGFDPTTDQQFRVRKTGGEAEVAWEGHRLGVVAVPAGPSRLGLGSRRGPASFEAVRLTAIQTGK
ncbi:MAG: glycoside hydrolase family 43 protein [Thermoanaerobaculia bacterium]